MLSWWTEIATGYTKPLCAQLTKEQILELSESKTWSKFMFTILEVISASVYEFIADKLVLVHQRTGIF